MASAHVAAKFDSDMSDDGTDDFLGSDDNTEMSNTQELQEEAVSKSGITDVMAKILGNTMPPNKATILGRGQTDSLIRKKKKLREKENGFQPCEGKKAKKSKNRTKDGQESSSDWTDDSDEDSRRTHLQMLKKREWDNLGRVRPSILNKDRERMLQKIATRGVVQLFNAVRQQQNLVGEKMSEAGSSVRRRDKVIGSMSKKRFLDLLDNTQAKSTVETKDKKMKTQDKAVSEQSGGKWSILRDDYMMGARMKDWDRHSDNADDDR